MATVTDELKPSKTVEVIRGQYHKFKLIPIMEHHSQWFAAGPVTIAVEARALGLSRERMVRGPSIHVFNNDRVREYVRFDMFGREQHYHYMLDDLQHNIVWGYDADANGPMGQWANGPMGQWANAGMDHRQFAKKLARHAEQSR